jgi:Leucine-rich repeat (LRR) protein
MPRAMAEHEAQSAPSLSEPLRCYCKKCGYALVGLESRTCPECGRGFDPANPRSFAKRAPRGWVWRWGRRVAGVMALLIMAIGLGFGWMWRGWDREQASIGQLRNFGTQIEFKDIGPSWLKEVLGGRLYYLQARVKGVLVHHLSAVQTASLDFEKLEHLERLELSYCDLNGISLPNVSRARTVREFQLHVGDKDKPDLAFLESLSLLDSVYLVGRRIDDESLMHLSKLKRLTQLSMNATSVTDSGLDVLKELPALERLYLFDVGITDAGLVHLKTLRSLRSLTLSGTGVTPAGIAALQKAVPGLKVIAD